MTIVNKLTSSKIDGVTTPKIMGSISVYSTYAPSICIRGVVVHTSGKVFIDISDLQGESRRKLLLVCDTVNGGHEYHDLRVENSTNTYSGFSDSSYAREWELSGVSDDGTKVFYKYRHTGSSGWTFYRGWEKAIYDVTTGTMDIDKSNRYSYYAERSAQEIYPLSNGYLYTYGVGANNDYYSIGIKTDTFPALGAKQEEMETSDKYASLGSYNYSYYPYIIGRIGEYGVCQWRGDGYGFINIKTGEAKKFSLGEYPYYYYGNIMEGSKFAMAKKDTDTLAVCDKDLNIIAYSVHRVYRSNTGFYTGHKPALIDYTDYSTTVGGLPANCYYITPNIDTNKIDLHKCEISESNETKYLDYVYYRYGEISTSGMSYSANSTVGVLANNYDALNYINEENIIIENHGTTNNYEYIASLIFDDKTLFTESKTYQLSPNVTLSTNCYTPVQIYSQLNQNRKIISPSSSASNIASTSGTRFTIPPTDDEPTNYYLYDSPSSTSSTHSILNNTLTKI